MASLLRGLALLLLLSPLAQAKSLSPEAQQARAEFNYKMFCRGCHGPGGEGGKAVPFMNDYVGHFVKFDEGREYLVRVPGSANAALDDTQLAQVLNWIVINIGGPSTPKDFKPYTPAEVGELRKAPLFEAFEARRQLLQKMLQLNIIGELPAQPLP
ncbi:MAG: cytochrome c, class I [Cellvibrionaceae bacterium]|nr:cytochrome c, class I [Cellvibrionaceae bacterium]MCV6627191.1 cytochrome c, class I [Cellvibrionaceae bacterium]